VGVGVWVWWVVCVCVCLINSLSLSLSLSLSQDVGRSFNTDWLQLYSANAHLTKPHTLAEYALINLGPLRCTSRRHACLYSGMSVSKTFL